MRFLAIALTAVLIVATVAAIVGGFALLARRLLGMRFGLVRLLLAGLLGFAVAGPIARAVLGEVSTREDAVTPLWFLILTSAAALIVAMMFLVIAEAVVPSGSLPGPLGWRRQLRGRVVRTRAPWEQVEQVLNAELGGPVEEVFARFDREQLAAASIAQVHTATLRSGDEVAVKVQRPGVRSVVERDLDIVARLARSLERRTRWARAIGAGDLASAFADAVREELDFRVEAGNMAAVAAANPRGDGAVRVPAPHAPLCTQRVLVMQRLEGTPLGRSDADIAEQALDREALACALLEFMLAQIMVHGVFHADPHPGNVMVLTDGRLGLLDFGSVGRLDASLRGALQRLLLALDRGDPLGASDALLEITLRPDEIDQERLERALGQFMARYLGPGTTPGVRMFTDLFRIVSEYGLAVPPEVAAVFRALATLEGTLGRLAPGFNLVTQARAFAGRYASGELEVAAAPQTVADELATLLPMLRRLPRRVERIASAAEHGRLSVHVLLLGTGGGPSVTTTVSLYQLLGYNLLVVCAILALRVLVLIFRPDR